MSFDLDIGYASQRGPRTDLEDFAGVGQPAPHEEAWGVIAAIADGVSAGGLGREAAQTSVMGLLQDYYATPATWDTTVALDRVIAAQNAWLADHNRRRAGTAKEGGGQAAMTTLTSVVLRGHSYTLAHVGDSRAYLLRGTDLVQLTQDHTMGTLAFQNGLTRAVGLDDGLRVDYTEGELQTGDTFVLTTDGVHGPLKRQTILELALKGSAQDASEALVAKALASNGRDNATALVIRVKGLATERLADANRRGRQLPVPAKLMPGDVIDGLSVLSCVFSNGVHRVYKVTDPVRNLTFALKTLHEARASDPEERAMLAHEAWLGARVTEQRDTGLVRVYEPVNPSCFYTLFEWIDGAMLSDMLARREPFSVADVVAGVADVVRALGRLHQYGVIHRDVKPDNVLKGVDGQWRLMDLGVALSGKEPQALRVLHAGTPSYMNPEQWGDDPVESRVDPQGDLFALGVTLYQWLTGRLPYGEIEPYQVGRYKRVNPIAPSRLRPDVPIWLDHIVLKAIAKEKKQRFETAEEMLLALERGASRPLSAIAATPLVGRDPIDLWRAAFAVSVLFNLLLIYWLVFLPKM
ncbi:MAG: bifunctional protein-serine/threonine kinase/phosphatase [Aquabacterium sp.]|jgi:serine/threonine protein phosphatase PrpC|nr:bifunctional protein-serine/threonine kinase/phosphatase [Aquabacterium sp.]MBP8190940.1 bifunctional protein-serine/threonine kinase/phosphatase [Aquabacterium sp.]